MGDVAPQKSAKTHKWGPKHERAFQLYCQGRTITSIAAEIDASRDQVSHWQNWPTWQKKWKEWQDEQAAWRSRIREPIATRAVQELQAILDDPETTAEVRVKAAAQLGKWGGLDQPRQVQISGNLSTLTEEELQKRRTLLAAALDPATPPPEE